MDDQRFDGLAEEVVAVFRRARPDRSATLGFMEDLGRLPDLSPEVLRRTVARWRDLRKAVEAVSPDGLSGFRALDRELALHLLDMWIFEYDVLRIPERFPSAPGILKDQLVFLLGHLPPSGVDPRPHLDALLKALPDFLVAGRPALIDPLIVGVEKAQEECRDLVFALRSLATWRRGTGEDVTLPPGLVDSSVDALEDYAGWLTGLLPVAQSGSGMSEEIFTKLLGLQGLGLDIESLGELLRREVEEGAKEMARWDGTASDAHAGPLGEDPASEARRVVANARRVTQERRLATVPPRDELLVVETPPPLGPLVGPLTYLAAGRWERGGRATLIVKGDKRFDPRRPSDTLKLYAATYPGRHLHRACGNMAPSPLRPLAPWGGAHGASEGWAHLAGRLALEEGFPCRGEPAGAASFERFGRGLEGLLDLELHTGVLDQYRAAEMLMRKLYLGPLEAQGRVRELLLNPGRAAAVVAGAEKLLNMWEDNRLRIKGPNPRTLFHDSLLYAGPLPLDLLRRSLEDRLAALEEPLDGEA